MSLISLLHEQKVYQTNIFLSPSHSICIFTNSKTVSMTLSKLEAKHRKMNTVSMESFVVLKFHPSSLQLETVFELNLIPITLFRRVALLLFSLQVSSFFPFFSPMTFIIIIFFSLTVFLSHKFFLPRRITFEIT